MQVVDTNRSKASFKRLNKQTLEGSKERSERKRAEHQAENKNETKRSIVVSMENHGYVQLSGEASPRFLRRLKRWQNNPEPLPVVMTERSHLFPYRTQKLSSPVPKVLGWTRPGRIGRCRFPLLFLSSSMAEHPAVNRVVVGSSPTWGA